MKAGRNISTPWHRLPNGNIVHRCGIELVNDGRNWRMTAESDREFSRFAIRDQGLTLDEAKGLADFLVADGAYWATRSLH
jgi:hypothetical protein